MNPFGSSSIASSQTLNARLREGPRPKPRQPPPLQTNNAKVNLILSALDKCQKSKSNNPEKRAQRIEKLIYDIVTSLRSQSRHSDHLLQTTSIWVLMQLLRLDSELSRDVMLRVGTAGVLYDIMKGGVLAGVTRQYATELCFYLSSSHPYPLPSTSETKTLGPLVRYPDAPAGKSFLKASQTPFLLNEGSLSDMSSLDDGPFNTPFEPYRVTEENMKRLDALFENSDKKEYERSGLNFDRDGNYNYSLGSRFIGTPANLDADDSLGDDASVGSSISSGSHGEAFGKYKGSGKAGIRIRPITTSSTLASRRAEKSISSVSSGPYRPNASWVSDFGSVDKGDVLSHQHTVPPIMNNTSSALESLLLPNSQSSNRSNALFGIGHPHNVQNLHSLSHSQVTFDQSQANDVWGRMEVDGRGKGSSKDRNDHFIGGFSVIGADSRMMINAPPRRPNTSSSITNTRGRENPRSGSHTAGTTGQFNLASLSGSKIFKDSSSAPESVTGYRLRREAEGIKVSSAKEAADVPGTLAAIDPLSLNVSMGFHSSFQEFDSDEDLVSEVDDNEGRDDNKVINDDDDDISDDDDQNDQVGPDGKRIKKIKMRIRSEKLIDLTFMKKLFNTKAPLIETQSFISRLENMLELLDPEETGYVTWDSFTRIILSLAPHLLRADVIAFMNAQTDDPTNLIDYKEFVISGKVMVVQKRNGKTLIPINGWLERQRLYAGDASTYTWKAHVRWFRKRSSHAVIWLIRRASRALTTGLKLAKTFETLKLDGKRAKALDFLLEMGLRARAAEERRREAKRRLLGRCLHAKKWATRVAEAARFLRYSAWGILEVQATQEEIVTEYLPPKPKQADYATFYRLQHMYKMAYLFLCKRGQYAMALLEKKNEAYRFLHAAAQKILTQLILLDRAREWLLERAEKSHAHCIVQDNTWISLIRIGTKAYEYLVRQEDALAWILVRGNLALAHLQKIADAQAWLESLGRAEVEKQERKRLALAYLLKRRQQSETLLRNKQACFEYLREIAPRYLQRFVIIDKAFTWLKDKAAFAKEHTRNQILAFRKLRFIGTRASVIKRRLHLAYIDLQQFGQYAKLNSFELQWVPKNKDKLFQETVRFTNKDRTSRLERKDWDLEKRWKEELTEAFRWVAEAITLPIPNNDVVILIGRQGFRRLLLEGELLGLPRETLDEHYRSIDNDASGCINFSDLWTWFSYQAIERHEVLLKKGYTKGFTFQLADIVTPQQRAVISLFKRYGGHMGDGDQEEEDDGKVALRRKYAAGEDSEEEEEEEIDWGDDAPNEIKLFLQWQVEYRVKVENANGKDALKVDLTSLAKDNHIYKHSATQEDVAALESIRNSPIKSPKKKFFSKRSNDE